MMRSCEWSVDKEIEFLKETIHVIETPSAKLLVGIAQPQRSAAQIVMSVERTKERFPNRTVFLDGYEIGLAKRKAGFAKMECNSKELTQLQDAISRLRRVA
jgi:hypothetical protein